MIKKLTYIAIVVFLSVALYAAYRFYYQNADVNEPTVPISAVAISYDPVVSPTASLNGTGIWYASNKGKLFRTSFLNIDSTTEYPLQILNNNTEQVIWSPNSADFIQKVREKTSVKFIYFDSQTKSYKPLPSNIMNLDWLPDGKRIAIVWQSNDKKAVQLVVSNSDATGYRVVAGLSESNSIIKVDPDGKKALVVDRVRSSASIYALEDGSRSALKAEGKVSNANWIDSDRLLIQKIQDKEMSVWVYSDSLGEEKKIASGTTINQVVVSQRKKYAYASVKDTENKEKIVKIDFASFSVEDFYTAENLQTSALYLFGGYLFYQDGRNGKLYRLE